MNEVVSNNVINYVLDVSAGKQLCSPYPAVSGLLEAILKDLNIPGREVSDLNALLSQKESFTIQEIRRTVMDVTNTPQFYDWADSDAGALLIQGDFNSAKRISPLSLLSASFMTGFRSLDNLYQSCLRVRSPFSGRRWTLHDASEPHGAGFAAISFHPLPRVGVRSCRKRDKRRSSGDAQTVRVLDTKPPAQHHHRLCH